MDQSELKQVIQSVGSVDTYVEYVRRVYEQPEVFFEGVEDPEQAARLFMELVGSLQRLLGELIVLFPVREVVLDEERMSVCSPLPEKMVGSFRGANQQLNLKGYEVPSTIKGFIHELGCIPPWLRWPPSP